MNEVGAVVEALVRGLERGWDLPVVREMWRRRRRRR